MWEDPREIHRVVVHFKDAAPAPETVRLEYWGSWWPERHLPKDREPGGGDVGWMELGNWWKYGWRVADAAVQAGARRSRSRFARSTQQSSEGEELLGAVPVHLKVRVASDRQLPPSSVSKRSRIPGWNRAHSVWPGPPERPPAWSSVQWENSPRGIRQRTGRRFIVDAVHKLGSQHLRPHTGHAAPWPGHRHFQVG